MSKEVRIALIGVAGAIIAAIIGGLFALHSASTSTPTPTPVPKATASETLSEFCLLVQAHGLDPAYQLYSTNLKSSVSPAQFDDIWNKSLSNCTTNLSNSTDTTATGTIATTEFPSGQTRSYDVTLIKDNNGYWRIDSIK